MSTVKDRVAVNRVEAGSTVANDAKNAALTAWTRDWSCLPVDAFQESGTFLLDRRGRITGWSVGAGKIKGYQAGQILGQHFSILYVPEDQAAGKPERNLQRAAEGGFCEDEGWQVRRNGDRFWAKVVITSLRDEAGRLRGFSKVVCDLTGQKRMEEDLRQSEERFRSLFHSVQVGAMLLGPCGEVLMCNQTAKDLLGLMRDPVGSPSVDRDWETFNRNGSTCPPENRPVRRAIADKAPVRNQLLGLKIPNRRDVIWLLAGADPQLAADGSVSQVLYTFVDVTKSKLAGDLATARENRYEAAVQASGQVLYDWNPSAGEVSFSGGVKETLGYDPKEIGGKLSGWIELIHPADRAPFREELERVTTIGEAFHSQFRMLRKDGAYITVRNDGFFFLDAAWGRPRMIGFLSDISDRLQLEERFRQALCLEGAGQLTGGVVHDFNNILAAIQGYSAVLCHSLPRTSPLRQAAEGIAKSVGLAAALTSQLLIRNPGTEPGVVDLNRVVRGMESMLRRLLGERVELRLVLNADGLVRAAPDQAEQVILNLAVNARDAMRSGGVLTIETSNWLREHGPDSYVMLAVTDTGRSMDPPFERFFTAKDDGKGAGLGLSTVFGIVKQCGGYIRARTEPERGSVIEAYWRRAEDVSAHDIPQLPESSKRSSKTAAKNVRARRQKVGA